LHFDFLQPYPLRSTDQRQCDRTTGLGTYSAKFLTEAQGGSIRLDVNDADNSTEITVQLPR